MIADKSCAEIKRRLAHTPEKAFAAFARAELVAPWLTTPSPEIGLTVLAFDFPEGGSYRFAYQVPGATTVIVGGSYSVIKPPSRIVFSWVIGRRTVAAANSSSGMRNSSARTQSSVTPRAGAELSID